MNNPDSWSWHGPVVVAGILTALLFAMLTALDLAGKPQPPELVDAARSALAATMLLVSARSVVAARGNGNKSS